MVWLFVSPGVNFFRKFLDYLLVEIGIVIRCVFPVCSRHPENVSARNVPTHFVDFLGIQQFAASHIPQLANNESAENAICTELLFFRWR
jgi:hypothetical protein